MIEGNKGEWSELYVLVTLLAEGKLFQSNIDLEKDYDNIYEVVKGFKNETNLKLEFTRNKSIIISKIADGIQELIKEYTFEEFQKISDNLYNGIKAGRGKKFRIIEVEDFLNDTLITKLKANSNSKADINLQIYDYRLAKETELGFSIKSLLGSDSTLFNTNEGNNFIYEVSNKLNSTVEEFNKITYKPSGGISKITNRLNTLIELGSNITYKNIQSHQLWKNLKMIDGDLPEILGYALYYRWIYRESSLKKVSELLEEKDPLNFYDNKKSEQKLYEYKIKRFLTECAMGMTSETPWLGEYDSFGGVIIAKNDGDIVCFHIYDFNLFRNYLINNTIFEQASTGEDENQPGSRRTTGKKYFYGWLFEEMDKLFYKINLQIRFK